MFSIIGGSEKVAVGQGECSALFQCLSLMVRANNKLGLDLDTH